MTRRLATCLPYLKWLSSVRAHGERPCLVWMSGCLDENSISVYTFASNLRCDGLVREACGTTHLRNASAELVPHLPRMAARLRNTATAVMAHKPDVLVTVDSKGFNFRLLRRVRQVPRTSPPSRESKRASHHPRISVRRR